ncbi:carboxymuconolactone decarboxylase family protein [Methyloprofundus sp.]|uniref:carboxymuconolactone decarboxylase family protein n=1 Tax=Methyloprofundus sp. TaxID=2020875 RepID=UPI003D0C143D
MTEYPHPTIGTVAQASRLLLQHTAKKIGFVPNLYAELATSPIVLEAYQTLSTLFDKTAFTLVERQLLLLSISRYRNCCYCLATHGTLAKMQKIPKQVISAVYYSEPLLDPKLEALRTFARAMLETEGWVQHDALQAFYKAGYQKQHVLGISFKTISNYVSQINDTPIDAEFLSGIPGSSNSDAE